jgi:hypothetical protein
MGSDDGRGRMENRAFFPPMQLGTMKVEGEDRGRECDDVRKPPSRGHVLHRAHRAHRLHASLLTYTELSMKYCLLIRRSICIKHRPKPSTMLPSKNRSIDTTHLKVLRSQYHIYIYIYIYIWIKKKKKKKKTWYNI